MLVLNITVTSARCSARVTIRYHRPKNTAPVADRVVGLVPNPKSRVRGSGFRCSDPNFAYIAYIVRASAPHFLESSLGIYIDSINIQCSFILEIACILN